MKFIQKGEDVKRDESFEIHLTGATPAGAKIGRSVITINIVSEIDEESARSERMGSARAGR